MKQESFEALKNKMISTYKKRGEDKVLLTKGKRSYTGNELVKEIEDETQFGLELMNGIILLCVDLLSRDKIHLKEE